MEYFEIKNRAYINIRRGLGIFMIVTAILWVISFADSGKIIYLITSIFFTFYGVYQLTNGLGLEKCWFRPGEHFLIVKWPNRIKPVQIHDSRIEKISLERLKVIIYQKAKKPLKLNIDFMEREQKKEVYEFLIEYSKQRNIVLEKHSSTLL
ncbi:MAG: hypothetical protein MUO72_19680 [Bacteroidales bacterium]|nr:hypothetical protein [Bacteroidales bacterium]